MTNYQEKLIDEIERLVSLLALADKKEKAKGEIEDIKTTVRHTKTALNS